MISRLEQDILDWLDRKDHRILFNERDLQLQLGLWLSQKSYYDHVDMEYYVPANVLINNLPAGLKRDKMYVWKNKKQTSQPKVYQDLYLDIVVQKAGQFAIIELKYPTREIQSMGMSLFDEKLSIPMLKNQGADNIIKYNFWKDVRRIELVKSAFQNVIGGFALMITNNPIYQKVHKGHSQKKNFSMENGPHTRDKHWLTDSNSKIKKKLPGFELDKEYDIEWKPVSFAGEKFDYTLIKI